MSFWFILCSRRDILLELPCGKFYTWIFERSLHTLQHWHVSRYVGVNQLHRLSRWTLSVGTRYASFIVVHAVLPGLLPAFRGLIKLRIVFVWHVLSNLWRDNLHQLCCRPLSTELGAIQLRRLFSRNFRSKSRCHFLIFLSTLPTRRISSIPRVE